MVSLSRDLPSRHQIMSRLKISKSTMNETLSHFTQTGSVVSQAQSGGSKVTTPSDQCDRVSDRKVNLRYRTRYRICQMNNSPRL